MIPIVSYIKTRYALSKLSTHAPIVLAYHNCCNCNRVGNDLFTVTTRHFNQHMKIIKKHFTALSMQDLLTDSPSTKPRILITFDDGKKNNFSEAFPILRSHGLPALFFVTSDFIGTGEFMAEEEIRHVADQGISIGSHSKSHADFGTIDARQAEEELVTSKKRLDSLLSQTTTSFAYPYGNPSNMKESDKTLFKKHGYTQAYMFGGNGSARQSDPYRIPRLMITDVTGMTFFNQLVNAFKAQKQET